ncbi:MAG: DUF6143 family protein [Bacillota bacterium]
MELQFVQSVRDVPTGGVNAFNRAAPPNTTVVVEKRADGSFPRVDRLSLS